jgi:hypothetical protein
MGKKRNAHGVLMRKTEGKRPLGNFRCRWEHITRINPKGKEVDWIVVNQGIDKWTCLVNTLMDLRVL